MLCLLCTCRVVCWQRNASSWMCPGPASGTLRRHTCSLRVCGSFGHVCVYLHPDGTRTEHALIPHLRTDGSRCGGSVLIYVHMHKVSNNARYMHIYRTRMERVQMPYAILFWLFCYLWLGFFPAPFSLVVVVVKTSFTKKPTQRPRFVWFDLLLFLLSCVPIKMFFFAHPQTTREFQRLVAVVENITATNCVPLVLCVVSVGLRV